MKKMSLQWRLTCIITLYMLADIKQEYGDE